MKTPREVLFEHHRHAEAKLNELRHRAVAAVSAAKAECGVRSAECGMGSAEVEAPARGGGRTGWFRTGGSWFHKGLSRLQVGVPSLVRRVWLELIWPSRRAWAGLAVVWLALAAVNVGMNSASRGARPGGQTVATREMVQAFREQRRVLAELLPAMEAPPVQAPRSGFRQRSDRGSLFKVC